MVRAVRSRARAGFALLEMLVATLLLMLAIGIAAGLLVQAGRMQAMAVHDMINPPPGLAMELLRQDIARATPPAGAIGNCLPDLLDLTLPDARRVTYARVAEELIRSSYDQHSVLLGSRVVLRDVIEFNWCLAETRLVMATITRTREVGRPPIAAVTHFWHLREEQTQVLSAMVFARGGGQEQGRW